MSRVYEEVDPAYAATCSDVTLCSNSKGFLKSISDELVAVAETDEWLQRFEKVEENGKVAAVMENKEIMEALTEVLSRIQPLHRAKDWKTSLQKRKEAQEALKEGNLNKALALASQAVLKAPMTGEVEEVDGGVSLALALWLRSEILLCLNKPQAALEDLKLALKERLPAKIRADYYWRIGHCYRGTGEPTRAKVSYELTRRILGSNTEAKSRIDKDIDTLDYSVKPKPPNKRNGILLTGGPKQNMPALSKLVKITEEENKGRFAVAKDPIKTGDVLLVDKPYAACLLPDYYGSHCLHCFKRLVDCDNEAPMWCPKCSGVAFCSIKCRDTAVSTYHSYECQFLDLFIGSGMSILSYIALRMITQAGLDTSLSLHEKHLSNEIKTVEVAILDDIEGAAKKSKIKTRKERLNRSKKNIKNLTEKNLKDEDAEAKVEDKECLELKAAQIYSLCYHSDQRKGEDYLKRVIMAMFLTTCLKKGGFFKKCDAEKVSKEETSIIELIVRNLQLLQFNAHEIYETVRGEHQFSGSKPLYIGVGIYPTGALFNHECYPAVARYFEGSSIVLRAIRPLTPGQMVSENYGPHFMMRTYKERQRSLACRYWFKCVCVACTKDWPTLKEMRDNVPVYLRCPNIGCPAKFSGNINSLQDKCGMCSTQLDKELFKIKLDTLQRCISQYQQGAKLMDEERVEDATATLCGAIDLYHEVATLPHRDTHLAQEALRSCFAINGNVYMVKGTKDNAPGVKMEGI